MPEQKQTEKININLLKEDEEKKYLLHVEEKFVEDIVKKVFDAKIAIAKNEEKNNPHAPTTAIKVLLSIFFGSVGVILFVFALYLLILTVLFKPQQWSHLSFGQNIILFVMIISFIIFGIVSCLIAQDIRKETDKNYIISLFAAMVALCSLGVSIVSFSMQTKSETPEPSSSSVESSNSQNP